MIDPVGGMPNKLVIIAGPTASGKSQLALAVAERLGGEIVNADSMQVYRQLRIMTARPGPDDEARVRHHLYGFIGADEPCSAIRWRDAAVACIGEIWRRGNVAVVVGGTGLYFRALLEGLAPVPDIPAEVRARARQLAAEHGAEALYQELARLDPELAAKLHPTDTHRVMRAWEVATATGRPLASWRIEAPAGGLASLAVAYRTVKFVLDPPTDGLRELGAARLMGMLEGGGWDELRALEALNLDPALPIMKAVGVRQLLPCLRGEAGRDDAIEAAQIATRRYAKRQRTWFRNQCADWIRIGEQHLETKINRIFSFIREKLLTE